jgi:hypothetical protein
VSRAVDRYQTHLVSLREQIAGIQATALTDLQAKVMIVDAFKDEILPCGTSGPSSRVTSRSDPRHVGYRPTDALGPAQCAFRSS